MLCYLRCATYFFTFTADKLLLRGCNEHFGHSKAQFFVEHYTLWVAPAAFTNILLRVDTHFAGLADFMLVIGQ